MEEIREGIGFYLEALRPCPFCGEDDAQIVYEHEDDRNGGNWYVICRRCGCSTNPRFVGDYLYDEMLEKVMTVWAKIVADWNTRKEPGNDNRIED